MRNMDETGVFWKALPDHGFDMRARGEKEQKRWQ